MGAAHLLPTKIGQIVLCVPVRHILCLPVSQDGCIRHVLQPSKTSYALADIEAVPHCAAASQEHVDSANNRCYTSWVSVTECDEPIPDTTNRNRISMFRAIMRSFCVFFAHIDHICSQHIPRLH